MAAEESAGRGGSNGALKSLQASEYATRLLAGKTAYQGTIPSSGMFVKNHFAILRDVSRYVRFPVCLNTGAASFQHRGKCYTEYDALLAKPYIPHDCPRLHVLLSAYPWEVR